jgi:DNA-binding winged helix-turn-helix (wHTH) protein/Tol biopolymer transport system component
MSDLYRLGDYEIDVKRRQIRRGGKLVPLAQKPFEVLLVLIARPGVVTKDELMHAVWGDAFVEESNLTQSVFLLRKALTDTVSGNRYVITLPGVGYQLGVTPVAVEPAETHGADQVQPDRVPADPAPVDRIPLDPARGPNRTRVFLAAGIVALLLATSAVWGLWRWLRPAPFSNFSIRRLTNSGDVQLTAISLSGRYVAFVSKTAQGQESLSIFEVRTGNSHVILTNAAIVFDDIVFSPDDSYIYYRGHARQGQTQVASEYRIPLLGGEPTLIIEDTDGSVAFLDSGQRVCFWRRIGETQFAVLSADADSGKNEKTLAKGNGSLPSSVACSPDGQRAAIASEVGGITMLDFKTGQRRPYYQSPESAEIYGELSWKSDGSGLVAFAVSPFDSDRSLLAISYPAAVRTQITHDLNSYRSPGVTADGSMMVARQTDANTQFESHSLPLLADNPEVVSFPWSTFLGWRSDDEIVGSTTAGGLKLKNLTTSQETSIQTAHGMKFVQPNGCGSSSLIASGGHPPDKNIAIWRMNADGSNLKQLSSGPEDILAVCTFDGRWVVYADNSYRNQASIYRVSSEGGMAQKIADGSVWFAVSHHGDLFAWTKDAGSQQSLLLGDVASGKQTGSLPIPSTLHAVRAQTFSPDDKSIFFIARGEVSDSVYELPLDGSPPTKQIEFRGLHLASLMVSPGGKYLGAVTAKPVSDAVLLEDRSR